MYFVFSKVFMFLLLSDSSLAIRGLFLKHGPAFWRGTFVWGENMCGEFTPAGDKGCYLIGGCFFQVDSKGLNQPENKGGKKPWFRRSVNQRRPIWQRLTLRSAPRLST